MQTEGIKYAGSKLKLIPHILKTTNELRKNKNCTIWDAFSGTTRVSQAFAQNGYKVISSDISVYSKCFAICYLKNKKNKDYYNSLIDHLNNVSPIDGWFSQNYGEEKDLENGAVRKCPWQLKNTRKLDGIREEIDKLNLSEIDKCVALTSLVLALDKVDNAIGHYASYLKKWSPRSYKDLILEVPNLFENKLEHVVLQDDIFNLIPKVQSDIAYLDPPYGSDNDKMPSSRVRYDSYYHVWTSIILNDKPELFGKSNRRKDSKESVFEEFRKNDETGKFIVEESLDRMLKEIHSEYVVLSYNNHGRVNYKTMMDIIHNNGKLINVFEFAYKKNVMAEMTWTNKWIKESNKPNSEYLFVMQKTK